MQEISTRTKSSKTTLRSGAVQGVKKPFVSKKCIFWPENDVFSKKSFYSKLISDQNYIICTCQKKYFQNKIMRLQFSPDSTYLQISWYLDNKCVAREGHQPLLATQGDGIETLNQTVAEISIQYLLSTNNLAYWHICPGNIQIYNIRYIYLTMSKRRKSKVEATQLTLLTDRRWEANL